MTPPDVFCTLYQRDPGFAAIAEAELSTLGGGACAEPGVWLSPRPIRWTTTGYGNGGGRQLAFGESLDALVAAVEALAIDVPTFHIDVRRIPKLFGGATAAAARVAGVIDGAPTDVAPSLRLLLVVSKHGFRLLQCDDVAARETAWLDVAHKPHNLPISLPVRLGRAMLNLTVRPGDSLLDPFCGTGTIPLLAGWMGLRAFGSDVSRECVEFAAKNLAHFGRLAELECLDARDVRRRADCIVTNLPYGLYSHVAPLARRPILKHLATLAPRLTFVTSERLEEDLDAEGYVLEQRIVVEPTRFERVVYVTRVG